MATSPFRPELALGEIDDLKQRLEGSWKDCLLEVQKAIVHSLERAPQLKGHFRNIYPRSNVKTIQSVVEKINDRRRDGKTSYDIDCVEDLIGAQMICPYADDLEPILDWLYSVKGGREFFQFLTTRKTAETEKRERENKTGYRAYHICLKFKPHMIKALSLPAGSENDKFELQIKTFLEAAWDAQTHDVTYRARDTDPDLAEHMKLISHGLTGVDRQTILLRQRIQEEQIARRELREGAIGLLFYVSLDDDQKKQLGIAAKNIEQWQQTDAEKFEEVLEQYYRSKGIDLTFTVGLAFLALYEENRYKQERALSSASCLVSQAEKEKPKEVPCSALRVRALLRWAFHKTQHAVDDMRQVVECSDEIRDKNSFVYFVSELHEPKNADLEKAWQCLRDLEEKSNSVDIDQQTRVKDTIGKFYIRFGTTIEEISKGLNLVQQANEIGRQSLLAPLSRAFRAYHEYLFIRQLSKLRRKI